MKKLKLRNAFTRSVSMGQFQGATQMSQDEIKRILELETRLGVLSAINYTFPFAGQSRPIFSRHQIKKEEETEEVVFADEDFLPKGPKIEQLEVFKTLENESILNDEIRQQNWRRNPLARTTTSDLLDNSDLENVLIIHPLLQENVTIELLKCPILLEGLFDDIPERKVSLIDVTSSTQLIKLNFSSTTAKTTIMPHLTNICHFLQARGYWADAIDPTTGKALYDDSKRDVILPIKSNTIRDFELIESKQQTILRHTDKDTIPGVIVTDAPLQSTLLSDLKLLNSLKTGLQRFYAHGVQQGYLEESGAIINFERALLEKQIIFDEQLRLNTDPNFNMKRFMKLYQFMTDN